MMKVIFHIDELSKWNLVIANVNNLLKAVADDQSTITVMIVANSEAVKGYLEAERSQSLQALFDQNVCLSICHNSMVGFDISADQLPKFVTIVPAAVVELVKKQHEGFAYIKP